MFITRDSVEKNSQALTKDDSSDSVQPTFPGLSSAAPSMVQAVRYADKHHGLKINFFTMIPLEVRLQVLHFLVSRRHPVTASDDLSSYAKTCHTGSNDVRSYHEIMSDPQQALLASRSLIKQAWARALTHGLSNRAIMFQEALQKLASAYTAVYLDVRGDTTWLPYKNYQTRDRLPFTPAVLGPESITAAMRSEKLSFIHLKCGFPEGEGKVNNAYHANFAYFDDYMKGCFGALAYACAARVKQSLRPPAVFLEVFELTLQDFIKYLDTQEFKITLSGLYLHGAMDSVFDTSSLHESQRLQLEGPSQMDSLAWSECIEKLGKLKYLHLQGWGGDTMLEGIASWIKDNQSLQELHLTNCCLGNLSIGRLCLALKQHENIKRLALDGYHYFDHAGEAELASLLEKTPELILILGRKISSDSPLEAYRLQARVICDRYPQAMRNLPEIYAEADFFANTNQ